MNHEDTKSPRAANTAPLCLCGGTDLWQIYGGAKGFNPVSMLDRGCNGLPFGAAFTPTDFTNARTGPDAHIINNHPAWIAGLADDPNSKWIGTNSGAASNGFTALYAIDFTLTQPVLSATLDLHYSVDNLLGGGPNHGISLNGTPVSGSSTGGSFGSEFSLFHSDIGPLLSVGTNTLYINAPTQEDRAGCPFVQRLIWFPFPNPAHLPCSSWQLEAFLATDTTAERELHKQQPTITTSNSSTDANLRQCLFCLRSGISLPAIICVMCTAMSPRVNAAHWSRRGGKQGLQRILVDAHTLPKQRVRSAKCIDCCTCDCFACIRR